MTDVFLQAERLEVGARLHFHDQGKIRYKELREGLDAAYPPKKFNVYGHGGEIWIIRHS